MSGEDEDDKQHDPTPQRLREARERGDVPSSADLVSAAAIGGFLLSGAIFGPAVMEHFGSRAAAILALRPIQPSGAVSSAAVAFVPAFAFAAAAALGAYVVQNALTLAPDRITPKWSRLDPVANARQRFGISGLVEFAKTATKLLLFSAALGFLLWQRLPEILGLVGTAPGVAATALFRQIRDFLLLSMSILLVTGVLEFFWRRHEHIRRNRMTRQELTDEFRQSEGDPHVKQARRSMAQAIASNRMMADVPKADVVIVNPTHYAVALRWQRNSRRAPVCVAKGVDHVAARIREAAVLAGVPVRSDPPTARALYAHVRIGEEISREHYAAVAAAIRFADTMRRRARAGR